MPTTYTQCYWLCTVLQLVNYIWWVQVPLHGSGFRSVWGINEWLIEALPLALLVAPVLQPTTESLLQRGKRKKKLIGVFCFLQKPQEKTTSCQRPAHDRKRKFIKSDLALDTEGRQRAEGEVNFTAPKHLAKFNWFVATCAANYRISITTRRPVMTLTSLCQWSETQIDLLLAAHVPTELQWLWQHISPP